MLIIFFRVLILYLLILIVMRLMGKRQIGELQPGEFAITIMISNMAVLPIEDENIPMLIGIAPIITLACFEILLANVSMKSRKIRKLVSGNPIVVIENGKILQKALHEIRYTIDDLVEGLRLKDIFNIEDVEYAIVETDGTLNVLQKFQAQNLTPKMINKKGKTPSVPLIVISDGKLVKENINKLDVSKKFINKELDSNNLKIEDVFIMTITEDEKTNIIKREG